MPTTASGGWRSRRRRAANVLDGAGGWLALSTAAAWAALSHYGAGLRDPAAGPGDSAGVVVATAGTGALWAHT